MLPPGYTAFILKFPHDYMGESSISLSLELVMVMWQGEKGLN